MSTLIVAEFYMPKSHRKARDDSLYLIDSPCINLIWWTEPPKAYTANISRYFCLDVVSASLSCMWCIVEHFRTIFVLFPVFTPPPKNDKDPFDTADLPENLGYVARIKDGVIYVYDDVKAADKHQPRDLPCASYTTFIDDMNFLIALIAQGPT